MENNEVFMQTIKDLVDALKKGFSNEPKSIAKSALSLMTDIRGGILVSYKYCRYDFYYGQVAWLPINSPQNNKASEHKQLHTHFEDYATVVLKKSKAKIENTRIDLQTIAYLSNFLGVETDSLYQPVILLVAFKEDTKKDDSSEMIVCYPSYDSQFNELTTQHYSLASRTWWQDACKDRFNTEIKNSKGTVIKCRWIDTLDVEKRKAAQDILNWAWTTEKGTKIKNIGLSRPYTSVRTECSNERGLYYDIDLADTPFFNGKLILSIQFALKTEKY